MEFDIKSFVGEATTYDKKEKVEYSKPKSWLKSVSAFANGEGGFLVFGVSDNNKIVGLDNAERDAEFISETIKTKLDPIPVIKLDFREINGNKIILLYVYTGQETPYYYIGDKQRLAFVRIGNESVTADRIQLKSLVLKGSGRTYVAYRPTINLRIWLFQNSGLSITKGCSVRLMTVSLCHGVL